MSYFIALNCAPADGIALVEGFRVHVLDALKAAGATVVKDEVLVGEQLSGPLEFTDSRSVQGESSFDKSWHSGFTIAYSKSKIVGGISVGYKLDVGGRNVLQLSQVEEQGPVLDER